VLVPTHEVSRHQLAPEGALLVRVRSGAIDDVIDGAAYREPNELCPHAFFRGCNAIEIARAPVVELDEDLFHIELYICYALVCSKDGHGTCIGQGRNWGGIHFRSDAASSLPHSEEVAIGLLEDEKLTFREPFQWFQFTRFDGTKVVI
jgi:hypothetical protein